MYCYQRLQQIDCKILICVNYLNVLLYSAQLISEAWIVCQARPVLVASHPQVCLGPHMYHLSQPAPHQPVLVLHRLKMLSLIQREEGVLKLLQVLLVEEIRLVSRITVVNALSLKWPEHVVKISYQNFNCYSYCIVK